MGSFEAKVGSNYGGAQLVQKQAGELPSARWYHTMLLLPGKALKADQFLLRLLLGNI